MFETADDTYLWLLKLGHARIYRSSLENIASRYDIPNPSDKGEFPNKKILHSAVLSKWADHFRNNRDRERDYEEHHGIHGFSEFPH